MQCQVPADLGGNEYLGPIADATKDISVQIIFCNAGYLLTGFFHTRCVRAADAVAAGRPFAWRCHAAPSGRRLAFEFARVCVPLNRCAYRIAGRWTR